MTEPKEIDHVDIVMVGTTHSGNIGAAARAMKTMCLNRLTLVDPQCPVAEIAYSRSSGAHSVLEQHKTASNLQEAIQDCHLVIGMSVRQRSLPWPSLSPAQVAQRVFAKGPAFRTALVFGREDSGLSNEELALCHFMTAIPSNPAFSSLNVAAAIQIMCYEIYRNKDAHAQSVMPEEPPATAQDLEGYFAHLQQVLIATRFLNVNHPGLLMHRLRRLYQRIDLGQGELNILRGILSSIQKYRDV